MSMDIDEEMVFLRNIAASQEGGFGGLGDWGTGGKALRSIGYLGIGAGTGGGGKSYSTCTL